MSPEGLFILFLLLGWVLWDQSFAKSFVGVLVLCCLVIVLGWGVHAEEKPLECKSSWSLVFYVHSVKAKSTIACYPDEKTCMVAVGGAVEAWSIVPWEELGSSKWDVEARCEPPQSF